MSFKSRGGSNADVCANNKNVVSRKWTILLCIGSFCAGILFTNRMWTLPEPKDMRRTTGTEESRMKLVASDCSFKPITETREPIDFIGQPSKTHDVMLNIDKTILNLEMELAAAKATQESVLNGSPLLDGLKISDSGGKRKYLMVFGINTAFSSRRRRDSVQSTIAHLMSEFYTQETVR